MTKGLNLTFTVPAENQKMEGGGKKAGVQQEVEPDWVMKEP